jgi:hypothetical protein
MIRDIDEENLLIDVYLKDGNDYIGRDIPSEPINEAGNLLQFWSEDGEKIIVIPMEQVAEIWLRNEPKLDKSKE